jgi:hypothetical protein
MPSPRFAVSVRKRESKIGRGCSFLFLSLSLKCVFDGRAYFRSLLATIATDRAAAIAMTVAAPIMKVGWT